MTCTLEEYDSQKAKARRDPTVLFSTFVAALEGESKLEWLAVDVVFGRLIVALRHATQGRCGIFRHPNASLGGPGKILFHCSASTSAAASSAAAASTHRCRILLCEIVSAAFAVAHTITALRRL